MGYPCAGRSRTRLPVALKIALPTAAPISENIPTSASANARAAALGTPVASVFVDAGALARDAQALEVGPPQALSAGAPFDLLAGNAFDAYGERLAPSLARARLPAMPTASALLNLAPALWAQGAAVPAEQAMPLYIRDKVAQTTAEREAAKAQGAA